jgi:hypothetical protein
MFRGLDALDRHRSPHDWAGEMMPPESSRRFSDRASKTPPAPTYGGQDERVRSSRRRTA